MAAIAEWSRGTGSAFPAPGPILPIGSIRRVAATPTVRSQSVVQPMAERKKSVDAVIIGYGWTGAILAKTLTDAGLSVGRVECWDASDWAPDFEFPRIADELKYGVRGDLWQPL